METNFSRVKLTKKGNLDLSYKRKEQDGHEAIVTEEHKSKVHVDLETALAKMRIHLGLMTGYIQEGEVKDIKSYGVSVGAFYVSGFSIGGKDEDSEGVVVTGHKILSNGKAVILNTPFYRFNEKEETRYPFMDDLISLITEVRGECALYLGGKVYVDPQGKLFEKEEEQR